nr:MAG TPA: protein of unknown function (DUF1883) [Caudoviricetes sp.]
MATSVSLRELEPVVKPLKNFKPGTIVEIIVAAEVRNVLIMEDNSYDGGIYTVDLEDFSLQIMDGDLSATEINATIVLCGYARQ